MATSVLCILLLLQFTSTNAISKTTYTLYTSPTVDWQTAVSFCRDRKEELVRVTSPEQNDYLKSLGQSGSLWYNKNNGHTWSSLHSPESAPLKSYLWQLLDPSSCLALTQGAWTNWFSSEPLNAQTSRCIKLEWSNSDGYPWRADRCSALLPKVICQVSGGPCNYTTYRNQTIATAKRTLTDHTWNSTQCQTRCTATAAFQLECWASQWTSSDSTCLLFLSDGPFSATDMQEAKGSEAELSLPQCFDAKLIEENVAMPNSSTDQQTSQCSATAGNDTSNNGKVTTTIGRQKQRMTYFPVNVTWSVANSTCEVLDDHSTLVMPKDSSTVTAVTDFLLSLGHKIKIWLGINGTDSLTWLDGSNATWPEGETTKPSSSSCVSGISVRKGKLRWDSASCNSDDTVFMCQSAFNDVCTFEEEVNKALTSDWFIRNVSSADDCKSYCNSHLYMGLECSAFAHDLTNADCYLAYEDGPEYNLTDFSLYRRVCFEFTIYNNYSQAANEILYSYFTTTTVPTTDTATSARTDATSQLLTKAEKSVTTPKTSTVEKTVATTETSTVEKTVAAVESTPSSERTSTKTAEMTATTAIETSAVSFAETNTATTAKTVARLATGVEITQTSPEASEIKTTSVATNKVTTVKTTAATMRVTTNVTTVEPTPTGDVRTVEATADSATETMELTNYYPSAPSDNQQVTTRKEQTVSPAGNAPISGSTPVSGNTSVSGNTPVNGNTPRRGSTPVSGNTPVNGNTPVSGNTPVNGNTPRRGSTPVSGNTPVSGSIPLDRTAVPIRSTVSSGSERRCRCNLCSGLSQPLTQDAEDRAQALLELVDSLAIDRKNTSQNRRKYTSAADNRLSARTMGSMGIAILVLVASVILALDISNVYCSLRNDRRTEQ